MARVNIDLIEKKRKSLKMKSKDMAHLLGVTPSLYSYLRNGKRNFTLKHIEIIWREFNIPLTKLIIKQKNSE